MWSKIITKVMDMLPRQTLSKMIKLAVVMIFFITTTGFTYSNNIEDVPDYIKEDLLENVNLKDRVHVNEKRKNK